MLMREPTSQRPSKCCSRSGSVPVSGPSAVAVAVPLPVPVPGSGHPAIVPRLKATARGVCGVGAGVGTGTVRVLVR